MLDSLSDEIFDVLTKYLSAHAILKLQETCHALRAVINATPSLWYHLCIRDFGLYPKFVTIDDGKDIYRKMHDPTVFTWGEGGSGRLNQGHRSKVYYPERIVTNYMGKIKAMSCTGSGMQALNNKGEVWFWGNLAMQSYDHEVFRLPLFDPCRKISSGRKFGCAISVRGIVYVWHKVCPNIEEFYRRAGEADVVDVVGGWDHIVLLHADQSMKMTHIANVKKLRYQPPFYLCPNPTLDPIVQLATGENFTLGVTKQGFVYWCRYHRKGPITPQQLYDGLTPVQGTHVAAGYRNAAVLNRHTGVVRCYTITPDAIKEENPFPDNFFDMHKVVKITFGDWHGGVLTSEGEVFTWGNGSPALGTGIHEQVDKYCFKQATGGFDDMFVFDINFGGWHSSALTIDLYD